MNGNSELKILHPWTGIGASILHARELCIDHPAALQSPCESCATSPCCSYLPLAQFRVSTLSELDYAAYLLNFERIELGLSSTGDWIVFYRYPCRYLDRSNFACTVHERPEQPHICRLYNPHKCWYKTALTMSSTTEYLRLDRSRFEFLTTGIRFNERGEIIESPDWQALLLAVENIYDAPDPVDLPPGLNRPAARESLPVYTFEQLSNPCAGCAAYCCKFLVFPVERPADVSGLDYVQFSLGFPGTRLGIMERQWAILIETSCRHLKQNRCSVFGLPQRPLACRYFDEWRCGYKAQFEGGESSGVVHLQLEEYRRLMRLIEFDQFGAILRLPPVGELRRMINDFQADPAIEAETPGMP